MKNLVFAAVLASGALGLHASAIAQSSAPAVPRSAATPKMKIGIEGAFVLPMGDWADRSNVGFGGMGRLDYMVGPQLALTAHPGFIFHIPSSGGGVSRTLREVLLTGGVRLFVTQKVSVGVETGVYLSKEKTSTDPPIVRRFSKKGLFFLLGGGYTAPFGLTVSGYLFMPNHLLAEDDADTALGVMITVGYMIDQ